MQDSSGEVAERGNELLADAILMRKEILLRTQMSIEVNLLFERERSREINDRFRKNRCFEREQFALAFVEGLADGHIIGQLDERCDLLDDEIAHPFDGVVSGPQGRPVSGGDAVVPSGRWWKLKRVT